MPDPRRRGPAETAAVTDERLPRADRIRRREDFLRIQREGSRVHTPHFVVIVARADSQRIGITVTKRVAKAAGRNRVKRLVREVFRRERSLFPTPAEIVVVARQGAEQLDYAAVRSELAQAGPALGRALATPSRGVRRERRS